MRGFKGLLVLALCLYGVISAYAGFPSPPWRDQNIYFIFTDRFCDGDPSNNNINPEQAFNPTNSRGIHGGDFKGIQQKLDYIRGMGATAIWITPIVKNVGSSSYHGYGAHDFTEVAPHLGTFEDFSNLVAAAHAKGIYVILDVVANHMGNRISSADAGWSAYKTPPAAYNLRWTVSTNRYPAPFDSTNYFHAQGHISSYTDPQQILGELSGLDDLKTETAYVQTNLIRIYTDWIAKADVDAFRIDTVKHVDIGFWQAFNPAIRTNAWLLGKTNFFQFGEVFDGSDSKCGYYTGTKAGGAFCNDSVLDYPLYFQVAGVFAQASAATKLLEDRYNAIAANYDSAAWYRLVTFLDNHDQQRFMNTAKANNNTNRLHLALAWLYTSRGIPCLYYGTEQNFNGGSDPANREDMFAGGYESGPSVGNNFNMTQGAYLLVARLNNLRRQFIALRQGDHLNRWYDTGPGRFAYARRFGGTQEVFVALNTSGSSLTLPARPTLYSAGTVLVNAFNTSETVTVTADADGFPALSIPGTSYKIFVKASEWRPPDPLVVQQTPAHGVSNISASASIVLRFSNPMNTSAVQSAFSTLPPVAGSFAWNAARDQVTFTPNLPGLPGSTTIVVRVATHATDTLATNGLWAPFETFFRTAPASFTDSVPPSIAWSAPAPMSLLSGPVVVSGTATDNVGVALVEFRLDAGNWVPAVGTTNWSLTFNTEYFLNGAHTLSARARDGSGNISTAAVALVRFENVPGAYDTRIAGGHPFNVTNCDASVWLADRPYAFGAFGYIGGTTGYIANAISGVCAQAQSLYWHERYSTPEGSFRYQFDLPPGVYEVTLLEAETFATGTGQRQFDVYVQGDRVLADYDILAAAEGMNSPVSIVFTTTVADAQLELQFVARVGNARASGIRARKIGDVDSDADGVPDWWMLAHFDHPTGEEGDQSRADDDADGDGFSTREEFIAGTDPLDGGSYFRVESIEPLGLWLPTISGRYYQVEANEFTDSVWTVIGSNWTGTGSALFVPETNGPPARQYRARAVLP